MVWNGYEIKPTLSKDLLIWFITPVQFYRVCYRKSAELYLSSDCFFKFKEIKSFLGEKLLTHMCFYDLSFTDDDCRIFRDFLKELT